MSSNSLESTIKPLPYTVLSINRFYSLNQQRESYEGFLFSEGIFSDDENDYLRMNCAEIATAEASSIARQFKDQTIASPLKGIFMPGFVAIINKTSAYCNGDNPIWDQIEDPTLEISGNRMQTASFKNDYYDSRIREIQLDLTAQALEISKMGDIDLPSLLLQSKPEDPQIMLEDIFVRYNSSKAEGYTQDIAALELILRIDHFVRMTKRFVKQAHTSFPKKSKLPVESFDNFVYRFAQNSNVLIEEFTKRIMQLQETFQEDLYPFYEENDPIRLELEEAEMFEDEGFLLQ